jgi:hypothetical protein
MARLISQVRKRRRRRMKGKRIVEKTNNKGKLKEKRKINKIHRNL